jgi:hypothetical protein
VSETTNSNLDFTYQNLAPLSERQQEALELGLNPNQFEFIPEEVPPPEEIPPPEARKSGRKKKVKDAHTG